MFEQIKETILQYVDVDPEKITPEARFVEDLCFNSYDFISLLGELEENFGVSVNEEEVVGLATVGDVMEYVEKLQQN